jgi:hypothetical protein
MDGIHDLGGMHGFGAVVTPGGDAPYHERWEPRVFALQVLIGVEGLGAGPGGRATREQMDPASYLEASYYERWLWSNEQRLLRKGTIAPGEVEVRVWDSSAEVRYLVVPLRPAGTDGLTEDALAALVTRDCMIGTAVPLPPVPAA